MFPVVAGELCLRAAHEFTEIPREFIEFYGNLSKFIEIRSLPVRVRHEYLLSNLNPRFCVAFSGIVK